MQDLIQIQLLCPVLTEFTLFHLYFFFIQENELEK